MSYSTRRLDQLTTCRRVRRERRCRDGGTSIRAKLYNGLLDMALLRIAARRGIDAGVQGVEVVVAIAEVVVVAVVGIVVAAGIDAGWEAAEWTTLTSPVATVSTAGASPLRTCGGEGDEGGGCECVLHGCWGVSRWRSGGMREGNIYGKQKRGWLGCGRRKRLEHRSGTMLI